MRDPRLPTIRQWEPTIMGARTSRVGLLPARRPDTVVAAPSTVSANAGRATASSISVPWMRLTTSSTVSSRRRACFRRKLRPFQSQPTVVTREQLGGAGRGARTPSGVSLGVACRVGGETACGRVGVAVWLPRVATRVQATLLGRTIMPSTSDAGSGRYAYGRFWTGFVHVSPSRIEPGAHVPVRVAVAVNGSRASTVRSVYLSAGWG